MNDDYKVSDAFPIERWGLCPMPLNLGGANSLTVHNGRDTVCFQIGTEETRVSTFDFL